MPEHLRALVVIIILSSLVFGLARRPASQIMGARNFARQRNLWYTVTLTAFLAHSFWIYAVAAGCLLLIASKRENNPVALYFLLLFAVPVASVDIPGFGIINYLISLSHQRLLALIILLPVAMRLLQQRESLSFGRTTADKILCLYVVLMFVLALRDTTLTNALRQAFYLLIDVLLPYFVISRGLKNVQAYREALLAFVLAAMVMALVGVFEASRHWMLYRALIASLGMESPMTSYMERSDMLRAVASAGHSIALGYVMAVAIGLYFFLQRSISSTLIRRLGIALLLAGLAAPLSRGPWVGAVFLLVIFVATGRHAVRRLALLALAGILLLPLISALPGGEKIINLLPFIGETESGTLDYRQRLIENSLIVIERNLWFGSVDYLETPEMEAMRQGQGIIDIVNTYIQVALEAGLVGLALFAGFFGFVLVGIYRAMNTIGDKDDDMYQLGRSLFATLAGALLIIGTVSSIAIIPIVYWSLAGLGAGYAQLVKARRAGPPVVSGPTATVAAQ